MHFEVGQPVLFDHPGNTNGTVVTYIRDIVYVNGETFIVPAWSVTQKRYTLDDAERIMLPLTDAELDTASRTGSLHSVELCMGMKLRLGSWLLQKAPKVTVHLHSSPQPQTSPFHHCETARQDWKRYGEPTDTWSDWKANAAWSRDDMDWKRYGEATDAWSDWKATAAWSREETDSTSTMSGTTKPTDAWRDWKANAAWSRWVPKCRQFARGKCTFGDRCRFLHVGKRIHEQDVRPAAPRSRAGSEDRCRRRDDDLSFDEMSSPEMK